VALRYQVEESVGLVNINQSSLLTILEVELWTHEWGGHCSYLWDHQH
jgi:hypothetical protein